jgi:hypothetical protein
MQPQRNKRIGVVIMFLATLAFFSCVIYFGQSGSAIAYTNIPYMIKMTATYAFLPIGLYCGLYFYSGKRLALQLGGSLALFLIAAFAVGAVLH